MDFIALAPASDQVHKILAQSVKQLTHGQCVPGSSLVPKSQEVQFSFLKLITGFSQKMRWPLGIEKD
jgi:hypothetical protein